MLLGAILHFTDGSEIRPIYCDKQIEELKEFAKTKDIEILDVYCDHTLKVCEQTEFKSFMNNTHLYNALVTKDFYHIRKNTRACMEIMKDLREKGITIYSLENGVFEFDDIPTNKSLRVATYTHTKGEIRDAEGYISLQNDIYSLFVSKKTNWNIVEQYADICPLQNDEEQVQLLDLIKHKNDYDLIIVNNFNDIHWRTSRFCKIREQIGKDIYSLQDGYLKYNKEIK